jgi:hypothetical protein
LCRGLLERAGEGEQQYTETFTEEEMRLHAAGRNLAVLKKKSSHKPLTHQAGSET